MNYPMTVSERKARREEIRTKAHEEAERRSGDVMRSLKCSTLYETPRHKGEPDGCKNDGSSCLCECHDPKE